jgi:arsenate reductase (thioredoxin)
MGCMRPSSLFVPRVLFLCTGNSARSQMAEGMLRHIAGDRFEALSAGIEPKGLNRFAVEVMSEIGIDISRQRSKDLREFLGKSIPYVITLCDNAKERCPMFPGAFTSLHWSLPDPTAGQGSDSEKLQGFRRVRDQIESRVKEFIKDAEQVVSVG